MLTVGKTKLIKKTGRETKRDRYVKTKENASSIL